MSFEEGRNEFIKEGLKKKRVDELSTLAAILTGITTVMNFSVAVYSIGVIFLILVFYMMKLSKHILQGKTVFIAITYSFLCIPLAILNPYIGLIAVIIGLGKFARKYRAQAGLSDNFWEAQQDYRYAGIIISMIVCIVLMLIYSFKILPVVLHHVQ